MNRKLAILGFVLVWVIAIAAIIFVMLPKLYNTSGDTLLNKTEQTKNTNNNTEDKVEKGDEDSFFYDKKVFVRHKKNDDDSNAAESEKIIVVRKNMFFKPPSTIEKPIVKPIIKSAPKKVDNSDFDIKPVPTN